jgi:hypothetical protein
MLTLRPAGIDRNAPGRRPMLGPKEAEDAVDNMAEKIFTAIAKTLAKFGEDEPERSYIIAGGLTDAIRRIAKVESDAGRDVSIQRRICSMLQEKATPIPE